MSKIVVIDPGHGGSKKVGDSSANNATGAAGTLEKDITLDLGLRTTTHLRSKFLHTVFLTRDIDRNLDLRDRAKVGFDNKADAFVSIHLNGDVDTSVQGTETWVHSTCIEDSKLLAGSIQTYVAAATGLRDRGVKSRGLGVLSLAYQSPATVLVW